MPVDLERKRAYDAARLRRRKELGICKNCPQPAIHGQTQCAAHAAADNARSKAAQAARRAAGLCKCGRQPRPDRASCQKCADDMRARAETRAEARQCLDCDADASPGRRRCADHLADYAAYQIRRRQRAAAGRCLLCGQPADGAPRCDDCPPPRPPRNPRQPLIAGENGRGWAAQTAKHGTELTFTDNAIAYRNWSPVIITAAEIRANRLPTPPPAPPAPPAARAPAPPLTLSPLTAAPTHPQPVRHTAAAATWCQWCHRDRYADQVTECPGCRARLCQRCRATDRHKRAHQPKGTP